MLIKLNILALVADKATGDDLAKNLSGVAGINLVPRVMRGDELSPVIESGSRADVVFVEVDPRDTAMVDRVEAFATANAASCATFVIGDAANAELLRRLMRAGVRDVLARPLDRQETVNAVTVLLSEKRDRAMANGQNVSSVCTFFNAKGGSGATMLAVNVACALAERHKAKVALLDFDLQFGDCAMYLDLAAQNNAGDALRQSDRVDGVFLKALMTEHGTGVHVLAAPGSLQASPDLNAQAVRRIIDAASSVYDIVIVDLPRVISPWTVEAMKASTTTFLVVQNNLSTIRDARLLVDSLPRFGIEAQRIELVNNRAMAKAPSVSIDQLKQTLKHEKVHRVRNDYETAVAAEDQGVPVGKVSARSDLTKDIEHLAEYIWVAHGHAGSGKKEPGFLEKFFGPKGDKAK